MFEIFLKHTNYMASPHFGFCVSEVELIKKVCAMH